MTTATATDAEHHEHESHGLSDFGYIKIALILAVLTAVELGFGDPTLELEITGSNGELVEVFDEDGAGVDEFVCDLPAFFAALYLEMFGGEVVGPIDAGVHIVTDDDAAVGPEAFFRGLGAGEFGALRLKFGQHFLCQVH